MGIRERLDADMKQALKARDTIRLETIRGVRGAIRNKEIAVGGPLDEDAVVRVIRSLAKQRSESIEQFQNAAPRSRGTDGPPDPARSAETPARTGG